MSDVTAQPLKIKYYQCTNSGIGILIYPQLRAVSDPDHTIVWDGRKVKGYDYLIGVGNSVIVNLQVVGVPENTPFYLSENTVFGIDQYDKSQAFVFDPNSISMAIGERYGPVDGGSLVFQGTRDYQTLEIEDARLAAKNEASPLNPTIISAIAFEVLTKPGGDDEVADAQSNPLRFLAKVGWPFAAGTASVVLGVTIMSHFLSARGLNIEYENTVNTGQNTSTTTFRLRFEGAADSELAANGSVPAQVKKAWEGAIKAASKCHPKDLGIEPTK
ncbi:hypothetical protein EXIGLDRAFT_706430 [Exidia glandulosa HHB12029]|uniref:Uncharacterized protein n=1 Tax=Exidia glandulosa HHB12029 TaxID=1314781 RepID=A0A165B3A5_EXIGL|nr:hypothetical protein EXIGLDRAFT_706430 [Exidia glandulosa HHB12029]